MQDNNEPRRDYLHDNKLFKQVDADDVELAYLLQNSHPASQETVERLVRLTADRLCQWIRISLFFQRAHTAPQISSIAKDIYTSAIRNVDQFIGQASIPAWLFALSYPILKHYKPSLHLGRLNEEESPGDEVLSHRAPEPGYLETLHGLPARLQGPVVLRYLFGFTLAEISNILGEPARLVHKQLVSARQRLLGDLASTHLGDQLQAYIDGLLDEDHDEIARLQQHLADCPECQEARAKLTDFEGSLRDEYTARYKFPVISDDELDGLVQSVLIEISQPEVQKKHRLSLRQTSWVAGFTLLFAVLAVVFIRLTPAEREFPPPQLTPTPQLPPVINLPPAITSANRGIGLPDLPQYIDPAFSSDGNWAVFASIKSNQNTGAFILSSIDIYDHSTNTIHAISESTATLRLPWKWWNLAPSISRDGSRIVYVSSNNDPSINGPACETADKHPCLDIFIYQRVSGTTRRITLAANGGAANGDSLAPTISADGKWVAFWSAANNLENNIDTTCQTGEMKITCLQIFMLNLEMGKIQQLPIRIIPGEPIFGVDRISLSADGRYLGFTITSSTRLELSPIGEADKITSTLNLNLAGGSSVSVQSLVNESEAAVYDREKGTYELENQTQDGTLGNGASSSPTLSADGRYVAFTSEASNLVAGDRNNAGDVFVRDRETGKIQLVSVDSSGKQGTGQSGSAFWREGYYSVNISEDGRYVVFESSGNDLGQRDNPSCDNTQTPGCHNLYVHDRNSGTTELVSSFPGGNLSIFPEISADGRWVSFMQTFYNCNPEQFFCTNVMLYDRQLGLISNLTNYNQESRTLNWSYLGNLELPWESWVTASAFSPDGKQLALGGYDSIIRIWQMPRNTTPIHKINPDATFEANKNDLFSALAFSTNGEWLAAGTARGELYIWGLSSDNLLYSLNLQSDPIKKLTFSPDGDHLVMTTLSEAWILKIDQGQLVTENEVSYGIKWVYAVDVSPKGDMVATARGDGTVWLQSLPSGKVIGRIGADTVTVGNLSFSPDGSMLATRSSTWNIYLWDIDPVGQDESRIHLISGFQSNGYTGALIISPDNKYLASTGMVGELTVWSIPDGQQFTISTSIPNGTIYGVVFSNVGEKLAVVFENQVALWGIPGSVSSTYFSNAETDFDTGSLILSTANDLPIFSKQEEKNVKIHNFYQLSGQLPPASVPTHLPNGFALQEGQQLINGGTVFKYTIADTQDISQSLYLYEYPIYGKDPLTMTVGTNATVVGLSMITPDGQIMGEYVQGDWLPSGSNTLDKGYPAFQWVNTFPSQRLRWEQNGLLIAIYYRVGGDPALTLERPALGNPFGVPYGILSMDDLVDIAEGMTSIWQIYISDETVLSYTVQAGDTCTGIADAMGSSIDVIIEQNKLNDNCDIFASQTLEVPVYYIVWQEVDFGCDGNTEKLEIIQSREPYREKTGFGLSLLQINQLGIYGRSWEYSVKAPEEQILQPKMINVGKCNYLLAFSIQGGDDPGFRVYKLQDGQMSLVLKDPGTPWDLPDAHTEILSIRVDSTSINPTTGFCTITARIYTWTGDNFALVSEETSPGGDCTSSQSVTQE